MNTHLEMVEMIQEIKEKNNMSSEETAKMLVEIATHYKIKSHHKNYQSQSVPDNADEIIDDADIPFVPDDE